MTPDEIRELPTNAVLVFRDLGDDPSVIDALTAVDRHDVLVIDLGGAPLTDFAIFDEETMREQGWVRTETTSA